MKLSDLVGNKWKAYPLMSVPNEESIDFEKADKILKVYESLGSSKTSVYEYFILRLMLTFGDEVVPKGNVQRMLFDNLSDWMMFYYVICEVLGYETMPHAGGLTMASKFKFYIKSGSSTFILKEYAFSGYQLEEVKNPKKFYVSMSS